MSVKSEYETYMAMQCAKAKESMGSCWFHQECRYVKPFRIYGNLYYVGDDWVCAHIVDTGAGLILFDAGNSGATAMLIQAIWEAGFNPADVKWLVLSHGHVDHIGAVNFFKNMFGTKIYMGAPDAEMFRVRPEYSFIHHSPDYSEELFAVDVEIQDGDMIEFGNTKVQFYLVPGHTEGCIACFFSVSDGTSGKRVGYYGGFGFNTLQKDFLMEYGDLNFNMRMHYLESLQKVREEKVDIFIGNHTNNVDLLNKRQYILEHPESNPFINELSWKNYLDERRNALLELMNDSQQQSK